MANPFVDYLGVGCALDEIAEQHNMAEEYGKAAILSALSKRLETFNRTAELVDSLARTDDAERRDFLVKNLKEEWARLGK
jgi:hypothetical protein